jgi:hypothetical protein
MNNNTKECIAQNNHFVFTIPAHGFVVALNLDWCHEPNEISVHSSEGAVEEFDTN